MNCSLLPSASHERSGFLRQAVKSHQIIKAQPFHGLRLSSFRNVGRRFLPKSIFNVFVAKGIEYVLANLMRGDQRNTAALQRACGRLRQQQENAERETEVEKQRCDRRLSGFLKETEAKLAAKHEDACKESGRSKRNAEELERLRNGAEKAELKPSRNRTSLR